MKPMLAATVENAEELIFPLLASPKLDGVRATIRNGAVLSRSLKPIPNYYVQDKFRHLEGYDGELIVGSPTAPDVYRQTMSGVMTLLGQPDVDFIVFDNVRTPSAPYHMRLASIDRLFRLAHQPIGNYEQLVKYEAHVVSLGYEGVILREPHAPYKNGRSTLREQAMLKLKRFVDDEAVVVGFEELLHNANEAKVNELGYTERSSHQANKIPMGKLGALVVNWRGMNFNIGTGFTDMERHKVWNHKEEFLGQLVKFKYLSVGVKDKPRHPVFLGWRLREDL